MFLHRKPKEEAVYHNIKTKNGKILKLTKYHLIYVAKCHQPTKVKLVQARQLKVGDCLYTLSTLDSIQSERYALVASQIINIVKVILVV